MVPHPTFGATYRLSKPFSVLTNSSIGWSVIESRENFAFYVRMSPNYLGNLIDWNNILIVNLRAVNRSRLLELMFANRRTFNIVLPTKANNFERLSFIVKQGNFLSIYFNCLLLRSFHVSEPLFSPSQSHDFTIFRDIDSENKTVQVKKKVLL